MESLDLNALLMVVFFIVGYFLITVEHMTGINKASIALLMAVLCWVLQFINPTFSGDSHQFFCSHLADVIQVVLFLLGAMTIVEIINVHKGFNVITKIIRARSKKTFLWIVGILTFFLSSILDNLTTTVVMITLLSKWMEESEERLLIGGAVVIAANAGGAWTPIGDVTTTMLWIGGQLSSFNIVKQLLVPSFVCLAVALGIFSLKLKGNFAPKQLPEQDSKGEPLSAFVFYLGLGALVFVPIFRALTGLPPFMGMLFGLSLMWLITDIAHFRKGSRDHLKVPHVLSKIDLSGVLFFLGILLTIGALETAGLLHRLAHFLSQSMGNQTLIATAVGLASAVVDNVPLVAATMGMYDLTQYPMDHSFWELIAYCAGTGGSILLIGSAAGVVFMGMEKVNFMWYLRKIAFPATLSYFAGIGVYLLGKQFF